MDANSGAFVAPVFYAERKKQFDEYFVDSIDGNRKIRGIITTASYEARERGVKTAMPLAHALRLCPDLIVVPSDLLFYHHLSHKIALFLQKKIPKTEQYSIDEFFGDLHGWKSSDEAKEFARALQKEIFDLFSIPVSIGIAHSKWTAKLATRFAKPYGILMVRDTEKFIKDIPVEKFPGIGKGYHRRLEALGIRGLGEIVSQRKLFERWGKTGRQLYSRILGTDKEGIMPRSSRQSIGISRTFDPTGDMAEIRRRIMILARHVCYIVMKLDVNPTRYFLKINYDNGLRAKGARRVERLFSEQLLKKTLSQIYDSIVHPDMKVIKISLSVSDFTSIHPRTLSLLELEEDSKATSISRQMHRIRVRFGLDAIRTANEF